MRRPKGRKFQEEREAKAKAVVKGARLFQRARVAGANTQEMVT